MAEVLAEWVASPDDPTFGGDVVRYEMARGPGPNPVAVVATIAATADAGDTEHTETLGPGTYYFRVRAVNAAGRHSLWSNEVRLDLSSSANVTARAGRTLKGRAVIRLLVSDREGRSVAATGAVRTLTGG